MKRALVAVGITIDLFSVVIVGIAAFRIGSLVGLEPACAWAARVRTTPQTASAISRFVQRFMMNSFEKGLSGKYF